MPPRPRRGTGAFVFHVFNRAIQTLVLFGEPADYDEFLRVVRDGAARCGMRILAYAVMPNHWHMILWPRDDVGLSSFMQWLTATHAKRWREWRGNTGRGAVYQARFRAIAVQRDDHLLRVCRYVERNPLRARLVSRAEDWAWTSASPLAAADGRPLLSAWPVPKPSDWSERLNVPEPARALEEVRRAIRRGRPFGDDAWSAAATGRLDWPISTRGPGRPPKVPPTADGSAALTLL